MTNLGYHITVVLKINHETNIYIFKLFINIKSIYQIMDLKHSYVISYSRNLIKGNIVAPDGTVFNAKSCDLSIEKMISFKLLI